MANLKTEHFGYQEEQLYVFRETFTGNAASTTFQLTGNVGNAVFETGAWYVGNVETAMASDVTKTTRAALYDSLLPLVRHKITVLSISATGLVTLDYPPMAENFYIWYWYDIEGDALSDYYRDDYLSAMEVDTGATIASGITTDTANFDAALTSSDDTVQKALDTLDNLFSGLTVGYVPYWESIAAGLVNSPIYSSSTLVGIGTTTLQATFNLVCTGGEDLYISRYQASTGGPNIKFYKARGTESSPTVSSTDDSFGYVQGFAYVRNAADTADAFIALAAVRFYVGALDAQGRAGGYIDFDTSAGVSAAATPRMRLNSAGDLLILGGTISCSDLSSTYVPYHVSDAAGLADSPMTVTGANTVRFNGADNVAAMYLSIMGSFLLLNDGHSRMWVPNAHQIGALSYHGSYGLHLTYLANYDSVDGRWEATGNGRVISFNVVEGMINCSISNGAATLGNLITWLDVWHMTNLGNHNFSQNMMIGDQASGLSTVPAARLEIEDGASSNSLLLKITQDDANVYGLVIGNDTYSTTDTYGLRFKVDNSGNGDVDLYAGTLSLKINGASILSVGSSVITVTQPFNQASGTMAFQIGGTQVLGITSTYVQSSQIVYAPSLGAPVSAEIDDETGAAWGHLYHGLSLAAGQAFFRPGTTQLILNGTFGSDLTSWTTTVGGGGTVTWDATGAVLFTQGTSAWLYASQAITTVAGQWYKFTFTVTDQSHTGNKGYAVGTSLNGSQILNSGFYVVDAAPFTKTVYFQATGTTTYITLRDGQAGGRWSKYDNVTVYPVFTGTEILDTELVTNGTFTSDISGWVGYAGSDYETLEWSAGTLHANNTSGVGICSGNEFSITAGAVYKVTFTLVLTSGLAPRMKLTGTTSGAGSLVDNGDTYAVAGANVMYFTASASSATARFWFTNSAAAEFTIDNVSVKRVLSWGLSGYNSADNTYMLKIHDTAGKVATGFIDLAGGGETLGSEINTGTLTLGKLYKITATESNHFYTACAIDDYFTSVGTETCDANNKVKEVTDCATDGVKIVSYAGSTIQSWASIDSGFNYNDTSYTFEVLTDSTLPVYTGGTVVATFDATGIRVNGGVIWIGSALDYSISLVAGSLLIGPSADSDALQLTSTKDLHVTAGTVSCYDLTDGYVPYHVSDAAGLANTGLYWDSANGYLGVGIVPTTTFHVLLADSTATLLAVDKFSDAATQGANIFQRRGRGSVAAKAIPQTDDSLGACTFQGWSAAYNDYRSAARIRAHADGVWDTGGDTTDSPGRLEFAVTPDGSATPATRLIIKSDGSVGLSTDTPVARLEVEDDTTTASMLVKITADDATPYALVIGNDTYSTTDTNGLRFKITDAGVAVIDWSGASLTLGSGAAGVDYVLTFDGETNDGVLTWMEDEDYFKFSDDILMDSAEKLQFRDTAIYLFSQADGYLNIVADTGVRIGDATPTNYTQFDSTGHQTMVGTAQPWEDLRVEPVARTTGSNAPTFEQWADDSALGDTGSTRGIYLYSFDDANAGSEKEIHFSMQMPHDWNQDDISIHVHWIGAVADTTSAPRWGLEYQWVEIGATFGANAAIVYSDGSNYTAGGTDADITAGKHYISKFAAISPSASQDGMSSILVGRLFRDSANAGDTYNAAGAKCGLLYIDAHYQKNSLGSTDEYTK